MALVAEDRRRDHRQRRPVRTIPDLAANLQGPAGIDVLLGRLVRVIVRPTPATAGSRSAPSAPPTPPGLPSAGLASIVAVTVRRTIKKTGKTSTETRLYISSLPPDPVRLAAAIRAHWSVENNLHWVLDVAFREDECLTRKDHSARNLAMIRRAVLNLLRREPSKLSLKRKRLKALMSPDFRATVMAGCDRPVNDS